MLQVNIMPVLVKAEEVPKKVLGAFGPFPVLVTQQSPLYLLT